MSAAVATFSKVPMTCRTCKSPDGVEMRREWGCDGPAAKPVIDGVDCPRCSGLRHDCDLCAGKGEVPVDRCPWATMTEQIARVCEYAAMIETGILPVAGGLEDQSESFVQALKLVLSTRSKLASKPKKIHQWEAAGRG